MSLRIVGLAAAASLLALASAHAAEPASALPEVLDGLKDSGDVYRTMTPAEMKEVTGEATFFNGKLISRFPVNYDININTKGVSGCALLCITVTKLP
jgi:hypothetical protein